MGLTSADIWLTTLSRVNEIPQLYQSTVSLLIYDILNPKVYFYCNKNSSKVFNSKSRWLMMSETKQTGWQKCWQAATGYLIFILLYS